MVVIGGITRLTGSGLSMVRWEPIHGVIPPLNEAEWLEEFNQYRQYPEYQKINRGMNLDEFKGIFWWEYIHRVWGRLIGLVFALPMLWFLLRGQLGHGRWLPAMGLLGLGGLQGFMGWYMVQSGLAENPFVSPLRLTLHLSLALLIYTLCFAWALRLYNGVNAVRLPPPLFWLASGVLVITIIYGGMVAGHKAGLIYNTYPLMGDTLIAPDVGVMSPIWYDMLHNPATVQFAHRFLAHIAFAIGMWLAYALYCRGERLAAYTLAGALLIQFILGVKTLIWGVPLVLGVLHQGNIVLVISAFVYAGHRLSSRA